jgi:microsomal dipeptidase-like Zn-dependent dipeptidase
VLVDMHCHYPMHLLVEGAEGDDAKAKRIPARPMNVTAQALTHHHRRERGWLRSLVIRIAANWFNYRDDHWRVSLAELERGDVGAIYSVLYEPFSEFDLDERYGAPPQPGYFPQLIELLEGVEEDLAELDPKGERHAVVKSAGELDAALAARKVAFMHCVEGGFHLGANADEVRANVAKLKDRGVVYVTLAHLFWRDVATDAPAIPFLKDWLYKLLFHQPGVGLNELGRVAVEAMYEEGILIDLSHMSERSIDDTFELLDALDAKYGLEPRQRPVIATHAGYRFDRRGQEYMLSGETVRRIAARDGVIGLIMARHQLNDDVEMADPDDPAETPRVMKKHIDAIRNHVPHHTNHHVAIGSDLDGFIKPTVAGIDTAGDLGSLEKPLRDAYGGDADAILADNALRMARAALGARRLSADGRPPTPER